MATILIVDDEGPVRNFLTMLLKDAGHHPLQAIHGAEALSVVAENRPDLVITDIMMPVLNGTELCRQLKAGENTRAIPVVLMSSASVRAADRVGADAFIAKPFDLTDMEALVQRLLQPGTPH